MGAKRKITIVFFDAGGGHRSAAEALETALEAQVPPWEVELLNLQEKLDALDPLLHVTGVRIQDAYNLILRKGWTRLTPQLLPVLQAAIRLRHGGAVGLLEKHWMERPADVVLSVIPHFNRALVESVGATLPSARFVTVLTDLADYPPHFWIEPESEHIICGTAHAVEQALAMGHDREHVWLASGMILKPTFYGKIPVDRARERNRLCLDPDLPTGIVLFGGQGSSVMLDLVRRIAQGGHRLQLIVICGRNHRLQSGIRALKPGFPMFVEGFTSTVHYYMALADFFIGKPGPGSISEALQFHLPVIVECNRRTLPQERYNAEWIEETGVGVVLKSFREINSAISELLDPAHFANHKKRATAYTNCALEEIPQFLEQIAGRSAGQTAGSGSPLIAESKPTGADRPGSALPYPCL